MSRAIGSWRRLASMKFKKKVNRRSFAVALGFISKRSREDCSLAQHETRKSEQLSVWRRPSVGSDRFSKGLNESIRHQRRGFIPMTGSESFVPWKFIN